MKKIVNTADAPAAVGAYSQAIIADKFIFTSGQLPIDPLTNAMVEGSAAQQAEQVMKNIGAILHSLNLDYTNIIKINIYLKDINDFSEVDNVYKTFFTDGFPARCCFEVAALPKDASVEVEAVALKN